MDSSLDRIKEIVRDYEQAFCGSVYFLSSAARCSQLAVDLQTRFYSSRFTPPSPLPAPPEMPMSPPTPLPPLPGLFEGTSVHDVALVYMSTVLSPTENPQVEGGTVSRVLYGWPASRATLAYDAYKTSSVAALGERVACTSMQQRNGAPLPCATALDTARCIDGFRPCGEAGDEGLASNGEGAELVMELGETPHARNKYPLSLRIQLPPEDERATLFYESQFSDGGSGYEVELFQSDGSPVAAFVRQQNSQTHGYRHAQGLFLIHHDLVGAEATDRDLYELSKTRYVHLRLKGSYRQLSLQRIDLLERDMSGEGISDPPPPPTPPPPLPFVNNTLDAVDPAPSPPPSPEVVAGATTFAFREGYEVPSASVRTVVVDGCGLSTAQCAQSGLELRHFYEGISAFHLSATGCCRILATDDYPTSGDLQVSNVAGHFGAGILDRE